MDWPSLAWEPSVRANTTGRLALNVSYLGIGQIASTALGILLTAVIGSAVVPTLIAQIWFHPRFEPLEEDA